MTPPNEPPTQATTRLPQAPPAGPKPGPKSAGTDNDPLDLIVISDLHLGRGKNDYTGRYFELEAFLYDQDFRGFCEHLCEQATESGKGFKLIFNGDAFDLLRLDKVALPEDYGQEPKNFAPVLTPRRAAAEIERILDGHRMFVEGVALVLKAGHAVLFLPGNHDIEIQWQPVREAIAASLRACPVFESEAVADLALTNLAFDSWFYHEPGRVWIEHGCQYDPENAFRYPLREQLVKLPDAVHQAELDNPLGNFFQRYLYNAFGRITFIVPSTQANARYMKWLLINQPILLLSIISSHWRFWWQVLRRVAKYPSRERKSLATNHERELSALAKRSGLADKLLKIDSLKEVRADLFQAIRGFGWQALKFVGTAIMGSSLLVGLWFGGYHGINKLGLGVVATATLFLIFGFAFLLTTFGTALYMVLRTNVAVPPQPMRRAAGEIAKLLDVPVVTFGHTHDEVIWRLDDRPGNASWYFNTGTWIAVFTHDVLLPRERVQFTFLKIVGKQAELLHWSPGRGEPLPVVLLDEAHGFASPGAGPPS